MNYLFENHGADSRYTGPLEQCPTCVARYGTGGNNAPLVVNDDETKPPRNRKYIVRRIIPAECCRLQGFPDGYADVPNIEEMSDEDAEFWESVRETYAVMNGKKYSQAKDRISLVKWVNSLHTDTSEYKMWGNGMCLMNMLHVMQGIVNVENKYQNKA